MDLNDITPGSYCACKYDNDLYFCIVNYVSMEHGDVNVKFMHLKAPAKKFFWPDREDVCWIPLNQMICRAKPPSSGSTARYYSFDKLTLIKFWDFFKLATFFFICFFNNYILFDSGFI